MDELRELVIEYKVATARANLQAKQEMKARVLELTLPERTALSKAMHDLHASGVPKDKLRVATGFYNNASVFNPVWDAYTPEETTDLRRGGKSSKSAETLGRPLFHWKDDILLVDVFGEGEEWAPVENAKWITLGDESWAEFDTPEGYEDHYPEINRLVTLALRPDDE